MNGGYSPPSSAPASSPVSTRSLNADEAVNPGVVVASMVICSRVWGLIPRRWLRREDYIS